MILMYHKVDIITPTTWWVTPADLEQHISRLGARNSCIGRLHLNQRPGRHHIR